MRYVCKNPPGGGGGGGGERNPYQLIDYYHTKYMLIKFKKKNMPFSSSESLNYLKQKSFIYH